jgi:hypothetical protein
LKGEVHVQGGFAERVGRTEPDGTRAPRSGRRRTRRRSSGSAAFDAGAHGILLTNGEGHVIVGCVAADVAAPASGLAANNATLR